MADPNQAIGNLQGRVVDLENQNESLKRDVQETKSNLETVKEALSKVDVSSQLTTINDTLKNTINQSLIDIRNAIQNSTIQPGTNVPGIVSQQTQPQNANTIAQTKKMSDDIVRTFMNAFGLDTIMKNALASLPEPLDRLGLTAKGGLQSVISEILLAKNISMMMARAGGSAGSGGGGGILIGGPGAGGIAGMPPGGVPGLLGGMGRTLPMLSAVIGALVPTLIELNNSQKAIRESGAITGQGFGAGLGATLRGVAMGANPFDLLSMKFATEIINTFRSAGFKDNLAFSLADSFSGVTKQIGEKLSEQILPMTTNIAATLQTQGAGVGSLQDQQKNLEITFAGLAAAIATFDKNAKNTNASVSELNANFQEIMNTLIQVGTISDQTGSQLTSFLSDIYKKGTGITPSSTSPVAISQAFVQAAPYLAGTLGISAPLALVGNNVSRVQGAFYDIFSRLAAQMPQNLKSDPNGYETYAAYLIPGFLSAIGMGNLSVTTVAALLRMRDTGGSGQAFLPGNQKVSENAVSNRVGIASTLSQTILGALPTKIADYRNPMNVNNKDNLSLGRSSSEIRKVLESNPTILNLLKNSGMSIDDVMRFINGGGKTYDLQNFITTTAIKNALASTPGSNPSDLVVATQLANSLNGQKTAAGMAASGNYGAAIQVVVNNTFTGAGVKELIDKIRTEVNTKPQGG